MLFVLNLFWFFFYRLCWNWASIRVFHEHCSIFLQKWSCIFFFVHYDGVDVRMFLCSMDIVLLYFLLQMNTFLFVAILFLMIVREYCIYLTCNVSSFLLCGSHVTILFVLISSQSITTKLNDKYSKADLIPKTIASIMYFFVIILA